MKIPIVVGLVDPNDQEEMSPLHKIGVNPPERTLPGSHWLPFRTYDRNQPKTEHEGTSRLLEQYCTNCKTEQNRKRMAQENKEEEKKTKLTFSLSSSRNSGLKKNKTLPALSIFPHIHGSIPVVGVGALRG